MKTFSYPNRPFSPSPQASREGFALIISISLMAFILLLLLSLTAIVQVEVASATRNAQLQLAREHARFGLLTALGKLQAYAGPDQRVSATGALFDVDTGAGYEPDDANDFVLSGNRNLVGIWNADPSDPDYGRRINNEWLISGGENWDLYSDDFYTGNLTAGGQLNTAAMSDFALMVGPGSGHFLASLPQSDLGDDLDGDGLIESSERNNLVVAATLEVENGEQQVEGAYAYWVGDEGAKAKLSVIDNLPADPAGAPQLARLSTPTKFGIRALDGMSLMPDAPDDLSRLMTPATLPLLEPSLSTEVSPRFHDLSFEGYGLLSDTRNGGLRQDLTAAFYDNNPGQPLPMASATVFDPEANAPSSTQLNPGGPRWAQLHSFVRAADGRNSGDPIGISPASDDNHAFTPTLTQFQLWYHIGVFKQGSNDYRLRFYIFPALSLHNPYSVPLELGGTTYLRVTHAVEPTANRWNEDLYIQLKNGGGFVAEYEVFPGMAANEQRFIYSLPAITIPPGETRTFSPSANQALDRTGPNPLQVGWFPGNGFYEQLSPVIPLRSPVDPAPPAAPTDIKDPGFNASAHFYDVDIRGRHSNDLFLEFATDTGMNNPFKIIYRLTAWGLDDRVWGPGIDPYIPSMITNDTDLIEGYAGTAFPSWGYEHSMRFVQNLMDGKFQDGYLGDEINDYQADDKIAWLGHYNPAATFMGRSPADWNTRHWNGGLYNCGNYVGGYVTGTGSSALYDFNGPSAGDEVYLGHSDSGGPSRMVLFEVPSEDAPVTAIAQLMHANLSHHNDYQDFMDDSVYIFGNYNPAYAIGNAYADPRIPLTQTYTDWDWVVNSGTKPLLNGPDGNGVSRLGVHYDYSYRLNEALWDRYFFSSVDRANPQGFPHQNARLKPYGSPNNTSLTGFDTAAASLLTDGSFNVNSASVEAWTALIASTIGLDTGTGDLQPDEVPIPRITDMTALGNQADPYISSADSDDAALYYGYRQLDMTQVRLLARTIVAELQRRSAEIRAATGEPAPFLSLADFINRNPSSTRTAFQSRGALQAAIDQTGLNANLLDDIAANSGERVEVKSSYPAETENGTLESKVVQNGDFETHLLGMPVTANAPGYLSQADLLARLGNVLSARSDTFLVRGYGDFRNPVTEEVEARAWCEAVVQRLPEYVDGADAPEEYKDASGSWEINATNRAFGRKFRILRFRWLNQEDV